MFGFFKKKKPPPAPPVQVPPIPDWRPDIRQPIEQIIERLRFYTNGEADIDVFAHGTCVLLPDGLSDADAEVFAKDVLSRIFHYHPDMNPIAMNDGNILVRYNHPAVNLVLESIAARHWADIDRQHQRALATDEVLITPTGSNVFDDFGKKALFGRCFMFMDAQAPHVIQIARRKGQ